MATTAKQAYREFQQAEIERINRDHPDMPIEEKAKLLVERTLPRAHRDIDTAERLLHFAPLMEAEGHLSAARHMRNAAEEIKSLREKLADRSPLKRLRPI